MRPLFLLLVWAGVYLQAPTCSPSCTLDGLRAHCSGRNHHWVPVLPTNITHLFLAMNSIHEINGSSLRDFRELQRLDLGNQKVALTIRNNAFLRQRKLTELILGHNVGLKLEPRAFAGLFALKVLVLYSCSLSESILSDGYLQRLFSLEKLDLSGNRIARLQPGRFFSLLTRFSHLNLKLNQIRTLCEEDLVGFRGKSFAYLSLNSNKFFESPDLGNCGNPFRGMSFGTLDLSLNGLNANKSRELFKTIEGTPITRLIYSHNLGRGFSYTFFGDPDESTFEGLSDSSVSSLDLSKNKIFVLQRAVFSPLVDAVVLDLSQNDIHQIEPDAFEGLRRSLRLLNLSDNLLGEIYAHTFTHVPELRVLDLSHNHIGALEHGAFGGLAKLRALHLTGNSLKDLSFPESLPALEYLLLGHNNLNSLYQIDHLGMNSTYVDISGNKLTNLEEVYFILTRFKYIQTLLFGGNSIKWCTLNQGITIPPNNSLDVLGLHDSSLEKVWQRGTCLDIFDHLSLLRGLDISSNSLTALPRRIFGGLRSVVEIDLSSNDLTYLEPGVFPDSLRRLDLSRNFLASPDPLAFGNLGALDLSENRFHCDCDLEGFLRWFNASRILLRPAEEHRCEFPADVFGLPLLDFSAVMECETDDEQSVQGIKLALFVFSAAATVGAVLTAIIYTRFRGHIFVVYKKIVNRVLEGPEARAQADELQYDAFICFSGDDYGWVEAALLKKLDKQFDEENVFRCCFEARDFLPGEDHLSNIRDAVWTSRKTLCVVSKKFLEDGWCLEAFTLAQGRMLDELTNTLVMLVVGKVAHYQLLKCNAIRAFVRRREYLTWPEDPQDLEWFYERLVALMLKDNKVKRLEEDQRRPAGPGGKGDGEGEGEGGPENEPDIEPDVELDIEDGIQLRNRRVMAM